MRLRLHGLFCYVVVLSNFRVSCSASEDQLLERDGVIDRSAVTSRWSDVSDEVLLRAYLESQRSLTEGLYFMWKSRKTLNLDGVIGTRIVEGELKSLFSFPSLITLIGTY